MKKLPLPNPPNPPLDEILDTMDYRIVTDLIEERLKTELQIARACHDIGENREFSPPVYLQEMPPCDAKEGEVVIQGFYGDPIVIRFFTEEGVGIATSQGLREEMEDAHLITKVGPYELTAVFDGHIGASCALHAKENLKPFLEDRLDSGLDLYNALKLAFVDLSRSFIGREAGCCANVCLQRDGEIWTANAGDARAILIGKEDFSQLSEDARPRLYRFAEDIRNRGGYVTLAGTVGHDYSNWSIAPARSLGDHHLYGAMNPRPKISKIFKKEGDLLLQACDGVYDAASSRQVAEMVQNGGFSLARQALEVAAAAYQGGSSDNITILIKN